MSTFYWGRIGRNVNSECAAASEVNRAAGEVWVVRDVIFVQISYCDDFIFMATSNLWGRADGRKSGARATEKLFGGAFPRSFSSPLLASPSTPHPSNASKFKDSPTSKFLTPNQLTPLLNVSCRLEGIRHLTCDTYFKSLPNLLAMLFVVKVEQLVIHSTDQISRFVRKIKTSQRRIHQPAFDIKMCKVFKRLRQKLSRGRIWCL